MIKARITVVCCYNDEKVFNNFADTLKTQTCSYELAAVNNTGNKKFTSCAAAYNSVINQIKTEYVAFSHQDILLKPDTLEKFIAFLEAVDPDDILGAAGAKDSEVFSNITSLDIKGDFCEGGIEFAKNSKMEGDTVDECFFGGRTEHFKKFPFDEEVCDNWHLYAAEACLKAKSICNSRVWIGDIPLTHLSYGSHTPPLYWGFYRLGRKYASDFPFVCTTCLKSKTDFFSLSYYCLKYYVRAVLRKYLKKFGLYVL